MIPARYLVLFALVTVLIGVDPCRGGQRDEKLQAIRDRLRAEAGACKVEAEDADLPMVAVTVLPGDTHRKLVEDLSGVRDAEAILRRIEPVLVPGKQVFIPRALLSPRLADPRLEHLALSRETPTLWSLVRRHTTSHGAGVAATVRTLQRFNAVVDPTRMHVGEALLIPRSLLRDGPKSALPHLNVSTDYRVATCDSLQRVPSGKEFPDALAKSLRRKGTWDRQLVPREISLVVIHTTEHQGAPLANVAQYLQRNRLANYLIAQDGSVFEIVPESYRSFGCGQSLWEGLYVVDHESINIELLADTAPGKHYSGIAAAQYESLKGLLDHIRARRPDIHLGRVVTHRMVAYSNTYGTRSRKGDPYEFEWSRAGLPDNSLQIDQDVLLGRAKLCTDERYSDRVTPGQTAAARLQQAM